MNIRNGYLNPFPEGTLPLGNMNFMLTNGPEYNETSPNPKDLTRTVEEIKEARRQADFVLVSVHAHEMKGADSKVAAQFVEPLREPVLMPAQVQSSAMVRMSCAALRFTTAD